jgi:hypothetical protein
MDELFLRAVAKNDWRGDQSVTLREFLSCIWLGHFLSCPVSL